MLTTVLGSFSPIAYGSYMGSGNSSFTLSYSNTVAGRMAAKMVVVFTDTYTSSYSIPFFITMCSKNKSTGLGYFLSSPNSGNGFYRVDCTFGSGKFSMNDSSTQINESGKTYTYLVFG